jgi:hypothetical protein
LQIYIFVALAVVTEWLDVIHSYVCYISGKEHGAQSNGVEAVSAT